MQPASTDKLNAEENSASPQTEQSTAGLMLLV